ncbi:MAG: PEP/pyruvate-binding domain-containing protein [Sedimentisphaerales bacterium]|nr:PEP/pyruvate-binding domain-containing protein [Sedimentisphaerales bacterium]
MAEHPGTGLKGLDEVLNHLRKGDNVVWQVDSIDDYRCFVAPFVTLAVQTDKKVVYMRFANHRPLIENNPDVKTYSLDASAGFETFSTQVHGIISQEGKDVYYVFDCLSDLLSAWATDLMIGNFFMITCPYLFELDTVTYFALLRNNHSFKTIARIRDTTQLLLDLYNLDGTFYVHPLKVWKRYSPTMFLPHLRQADKFFPLTSSVDASRLFSRISEQGIESAERALDHWDLMFIHAKELSQLPKTSQQENQKTVDHLCRVMIGREKRILALAKKYFTLDDLLNIKDRLIGTGFIGGKAVGMLLANRIVSSDDSPALTGRLEPHDSFYVGSDVFYSYIVENDWWKPLMEHKTRQGYFKVASELRERLLKGRFPDQIREQFQQMLEYFGQSPIIVRSSSLLEDAFGNAFAGKYVSLFCANQGSPEQRSANFEDAVRQVYASTMGEDALIYRLQRGLDKQDEQMALLVQRVSGSYRNSYFFPDLAGVALSYNTFVWNPNLDPKAGMLRLVVGLGTRAVGRVEDDYPQTIALDAPLLRPLDNMEDVRRFSQHYVDLLDIRENRLDSLPIQELLGKNINLQIDLLAVPDHELNEKSKHLKLDRQKYWILTFEKLLKETDFVPSMQKILKRLESAYHYPVDVEFTVNFTGEAGLMLNLLQCRPLQTKGRRPAVTVPETIDQARVLFSCTGYFMGGSISVDIKRIVFVDPIKYEALPIRQKYDVARAIGSLNKQITNREDAGLLLLGPGRWGTTTPSLGVPVSFSEINNVSVLGELACEGTNLVPDLSFGTHFFQDLVETDIFYVAIFPGRKGFSFNEQWFASQPNHLERLLPEKAKYADVIKVIDLSETPARILGDILSQKVLSFLT